MSTDPVVTDADADTGTSFNRYTYGLNNPYKFIDPDGRNPWALRLAYTAGYEAATYLGAGLVGIYLSEKLYNAIHKDPV